jgi:hypothetical protein
MTVHSLAVYAGANPFYIAVIADIARRARLDGSSLTFLDLSRIVGPVNPHPAACEVIERAGGTYILANPNALVEAGRALPCDVTDANTILSTRLESSVRSALITEFRDEFPENDPRWSRRRAESQEQACTVARLVTEYLCDDQCGMVHVPNGRFPYQAATAIVATDLGREVRFFELGEGGLASYFHHDYQTLDYFRTQQAVLAKIHDGLSPDAIDRAREWFAERSNGIGHIFGRAWAPDAPSEVPTDQRVAAIFTTSEDEYAELNDDWRPHQWENQWAAIEYAARYLHDRGYLVKVRVHPNLASKSRRAFKRALRNQERLTLLGAEIEIVRHDAPVSSYALVEESDVVVVWNSTVGLEAVAAGTPVLCLTAAYYDKVCSVSTWYGEDQDPQLAHLKEKLDPDSAIRFRAGLSSRDKMFLPESADDYEYLVGTAARSRIWRWTGVEPILVAPGLWWDLIRNRRPSATLRVLAAWMRRSA